MIRAITGLWGRWRALRRRGQQVLGMNQRNLRLIYPNNPRRHFPLADDKLKTKERLIEAGVPVPKTHQVYRYFYELAQLESDLSMHTDFVIKPAHGSGGGGIVVIAGRDGADWAGPGGRHYPLETLRRHVSDIIFGVYSFDLSDAAFIEERVLQHALMNRLSPQGLADVRVILLRDEPLLAMTRLPTAASGGRANLHQGAVGVGIDLETGRTTHAILGNSPTETHPDSGLHLIGQQIPWWGEVLAIARRAACAMPLKYLGVDICLGEQGPMMLEINVRPGLQIQNANLLGLRGRVAALQSTP